jgi:hypothetical protein
MMNKLAFRFRRPAADQADTAARRAARFALAAPSFNGRTAASGAAYRGSNPWGAAKSHRPHCGPRKELAPPPTTGLFVHIILAEEFFPILNKADEYDHGGAHQADEKHRFKQPHCKESQLHEHDCSALTARLARVRTSADSAAPAGRVEFRMDGWLAKRAIMREISFDASNNRQKMRRHTPL